MHTEGQDPQGKSVWRLEPLRDREVVPLVGLGTLKKNALQLRARQSKSVLSVDLQSSKASMWASQLLGEYPNKGSLLTEALCAFEVLF